MNYERLKQTYAIPICKNGTSIGFYLNLNSQKETIFYGDLQDVKKMIINEASENILQIKSRKLGSLFNDIEASVKSDELKYIVEGLNNVLKNGLGNKKSEPYLIDLENIYLRTLGKNIVTSYMITHIYNVFIKLHNEQNSEVSIFNTKKYFDKFSTEFNKTISNLILDSKYLPVLSINNAKLIETQDINNEVDYCQLELLPKRKNGMWATYYLSTGSLLPLIHVYYDQLKVKNLYIRHCAICNKILVLDKVNNYVVCDSEKCQKEKNRTTVKKSRANIQNGSLRALYDTFFNRINASRCASLNEISRIEFDSKFKTFCTEAKAKKRELELESDIESDNNTYQIYSAYLDNAEKKFKLLIKKFKGGEDNA